MPEAQTLPSWDEANSQSNASTPPGLPSWEEATSTADKPSMAHTIGSLMDSTALSPERKIQDISPPVAAFMKGTSVGRIMGAFGHDFGQTLDAKSVGLDESDMKSFHIDNETLNGLTDLHKKLAYGARDGLLVPAAYGLDAAYRGGAAFFSGTEAALGQIGAETGIAGAEKEAKFAFEGYTEGFPMGIRAGLGLAPKIPSAKSMADSLWKSRSEAVIGEGEGGYFGTTEPTPEQAFERRAATQEIPPEEPKVEPTPSGPTVHEAARNIAPETFKEYDDLTTQRDTLARWNRELAAKHLEETTANAPHNDEIEALKAKLDGANPRKAKIYQDKIDELTAKNNEFIESRGISPDMQRVQDLYKKADYRLREMAPEVSQAYRTAQEHLPEVESVEPEPVAETEETPAPTADVAPETASQDASTADPETQMAELEKQHDALPEGDPKRDVLKEQMDKLSDQAIGKYKPQPVRQSIVADVTKKLVDAGRPQEEAAASAQLVKAHYEARSKRFNGTKGTPEEMYERDAANIRAGKDRDTSSGRILNQKQSGYTKLATDKAKAIITLFKRADASTFLHESGHHWLDEMMRDDAEEGAPTGLKSDAKTVRDWLGVEEGEEIPTKAHEKFARGFERYLMEGVAPNKELAGIFAKFKEWLTNIYKIVENLKSPITDDIRHVFDRLLSTESGKTVIADEYAPQPKEAEGAAVEVPPAEDSKSSPTNAHAPIKKSGTKFVDKAGNIRVDLLNAPDDIDSVIRDVANENNGFMDARGVVSDAQVMAFADAMGSDAKQINLQRVAEKFGKGNLASIMLAGRKLLIESATSVVDLMKKAAEGDDQDVIRYAEARARHVMIQEHLSAVTAEAGRALRAFHDMEGGEQAQMVSEFLQNSTGRTLNQLRQEAKLGSKLDTPQKVSKFISDSQKPSFGQMILEYWVNGLISGPATHTTYMVGNALLGVWKAVPETSIASLIGKAHEVFGKEGGGIALGEVGAQIKGAAKAIPSAIAAAGKSIKTGVTTLLPGEEARKLPFQPGAELVKPGQITNAQMNWREVGSGIFSAFRGIPEAFIAGDGIVRGNATLGVVKSHLGTIPDVAVAGKQIPVGSTLRAPARAIAAIHSFFRTLNYSMEKSALAYRTAADEGLSGNAFDARVADIITNPSEEIMTKAVNTATDLTLMGKGGAFTQALSRLTNATTTLPLLGETRLLKFIDPFVHISSNVIEQSILRRTPIGLLSAEIRADLAGVNGAEKRDFAQARMAVGTTLAVLGCTLAAQGVLSGSGPSGKAEAAAWRMAGNQPHSVKIGETWYDIHRLGPLGMLLGVSADLYESAHAVGKEDASQVSSMLVHAFAQNVLDESFMRGPAELMQALSDHDRYGAAYVRNLAASFVPFSVGMSQVARGIDPYTRQTRTVMDTIKAKIPYVSEGLFPRRDVWGQPIASRDVLGVKGLSAIYETRINKDPVNQAILRVGKEFSWWPDQPERKIRGVKLTDQQYDDYSRLAGTMSKMRLDAIVNTPGFESMPVFAQYKIMQKTIETSRETARTLVMMQNPDIIKEATDHKLKLAGRNP